MGTASAQTKLVRCLRLSVGENIIDQVRWLLLLVILLLVSWTWCSCVVDPCDLLLLSFMDQGFFNSFWLEMWHWVIKTSVKCFGPSWWNWAPKRSVENFFALANGFFCHGRIFLLLLNIVFCGWVSERMLDVNDVEAGCFSSVSDQSDDTSLIFYYHFWLSFVLPSASKIGELP